MRTVNIKAAIDLAAQVDQGLTRALADIVRGIQFEQRAVRQRLADLERGR